ncbi:putative natural killer cell receptor 2B4-like [Triplophysa rosa]|uniref:Natural killer cell receptor 2B4-like n=1 Tax=Triplophysa rosa TaxID=992332 RepID=A0A9W7T5R5_TRIRA|nr:putative natural killer cell receptor 2B4-like [Triplophysa rosa]
MSDVILFCLCLWSLSAVFCVSVSVTEGESVTLSVNLTEHQRKQGISWMFGARGYLIAEISRGDGKVKTYEDQADGRFRDRLTLDQTGSLTITNTRITDSGLYEVTNTSTNIKLNTFIITVHAYLPVPVITNSSGSSSSKCVVLCSVMDVSHVSVSWYKGKSLLSSISVSEHRDIINISLHLECLDDSYTCVINNSFTNQTQHLNTDVCHKCSGFCSCGLTEAAIRLVLSALVGVATVAVMVSDVRSRRDGQKMGSEQKKMGSDIQITDQ